MTSPLGGGLQLPPGGWMEEVQRMGGGPLVSYHGDPAAALQQLEQARLVHAQTVDLAARLQRAYGHDIEGTVTMSAALWCDYGQHAFSERDPKQEQWQRRIKNDETGETETVIWDVCGRCVSAGGSPSFNAAERAAIMQGGAPGDQPNPNR